MPADEEEPERDDRIVDERDHHARREAEVEAQPDVHQDHPDRVDDRQDAVDAQLLSYLWPDVVGADHLHLIRAVLLPQRRADLVARALGDDRVLVLLSLTRDQGPDLLHRRAQLLHRRPQRVLVHRLLEEKVELVPDLRIEAEALQPRDHLGNGVLDRLGPLRREQRDALDADEELVLALASVPLDGGLAESLVRDQVADLARIHRLLEMDLQLGAASEVDAVIEPGPDDHPEQDQRVHDQRDRHRDAAVLDEVVGRARFDQIEVLHFHDATPGNLSRLEAHGLVEAAMRDEPLHDRAGDHDGGEHRGEQPDDQRGGEAADRP